MSERTSNPSELPSLPYLPRSQPGTKDRRWVERLRKAESRNVTYMDESFPIAWERAAGAIVEDSDGDHYLDFTSAFGVALAGHGHPSVVEALHRQTDRLIHGMGDVHPPSMKVSLLEKLSSVSPWPDALALLTTSGSEAVEVALKTAHKATGRPGVIAFKGAYHGLTLGALAVTDRDHFRRPFVDRISPHVTFVPYPAPGFEPGPFTIDPLEAVREAIDGSPTPVGAIIIEPIQGRAGVRIPLPRFIEALADLARDKGALLIFDEIFTGFGRTGRLFAGEWEGVVPDLMCVGKALGGGMPLSACLGPRSVMDAWPESEGEAIHTSTFLGHPLSCAGALGFLSALEKEGLVAKAGKVGEALYSQLHARIGDHPAVVEIRGRGLMIGIELTLPEEGYPALGVQIVNEALKRGLLLLPAGPQGEVVELTPPAILTPEQVAWGVAVLGDAIETVCGT